MSITGGADECDCADCKKDKPSSSPSAPVSAGGWPIHNAYNPSPASYEQSPPAWTGYQYPPSRFDAYAPSNDSGISDSSRNSERKRTSMPPPPRPASTYSHATSSSSYSGGYGNYFNNSPPSAHTAPTPSSTCPPTAFSAYAPPPLNSSAYSSAAYASYAPSQSTIPVYGSSYDDWGRTASTQNLSPGTSYPSEYSSMPPLPSLGPSTSNRRNSLRANAAVASYNEYDDYNNLPQPPQRRSSRASAERPSWSQAPYIEGFQDRSVSVPPQGTIAEPIRRRTTTPGPAPSRRRDSGNFNQLSGRLGPSALSRAMESCTIVDEPPPRTHSRSHSDYYGYGPGQGQLARRDPGTVMYPSNSDSGSSSRSDPREDLNPINIQRNSSSGAHRSPPHKSPPHHRKSEGIEYGMASYRYVQQRQQAVHEQLQYGALEHGSARDPVAADYPDYPYRPSLYGRRATMGSAGF